MIKRLLSCVREFKTPSVISLIFITFEAVIDVFLPFITADLVNNIENGTDMNTVLKTGALLLVLALLSLICGVVAGIASAKASAGFAKNLRHDIFTKIQGYSFENIDKFSSSSLVTRMTTDVTNVQMAYMMIIRIAVRAPLMLIFSVIMAYIMGGALATSFVVIIPFLVCGLLTVAKYAMPSFRKVFKKYDRLNESIEENVRGMRVVKGFSREEYEKKKFGAAAENIRDDFTKAERIVACNTPLMQACVYFNMIFVLYVGSKLIISGGGLDLNVGDLTAMLTYGMQILIQLMMLSMIYVMLTMSSEAMKRIYEVLKEEPSIENPENPVMNVQNGKIDFNNVSFKYFAAADRCALENFDLHIKSGMTVGILGATGSGKSTIVQLIPRLYDISEGTLTVGDVDVRDYDLDTRRNSVARVLQKNQRCSGTIRDNLKWGNPDATDDEIIEALKLSQAYEFVSSFEKGLDTFIEQGGANVSGGQKQRLCIARALLKKPKVLILDDSTSAVDTKTDMLIRRGFKKFIPDTTKIIIAQRVASVEDADIIVVMEGGRISASGTHARLMESSDIYREIYDQQMKAGGAENE